MSPDIRIIDPTQFEGWDALILSHPGCSFFHSSAWARVLSESYGYTPGYFTLFDGETLAAMIPSMEVKSILTGKRGISLPFTDYCEPIVSDKIAFDPLFKYAVEFGKRRGWKYFELRGGEGVPDRARASSVCLGHTLDLRKSESDLSSSLRDSTRRSIRKAVSEGVEVTVSDSLDSIREFCRMNHLTRREHGLPPQPDRFFRKVHEHVISRNLGRVVLASYGKRTIAGAVFFHFGGKALYKYGASDRGYQRLRANNLVMWEAIKGYRAEGMKTLSLGRTEPEHKGLIQFKSGWGATEGQIHYYRYDLRQGEFVEASSRTSGFHNRIFRKMPVSLLNAAGNWLYRHAG